MHALVIFFVLLMLVFLVMSIMTQPKEKLQQTWSNMASPFTSKTRDWATPMKAWAEASLGHERQLQAWLLALPNEGLQALGEKIAEFCAEMNVGLAWLADPAESTDLAIKQAAEEMVVDYCKICLKAVRNQKPAN